MIFRIHLPLELWNIIFDSNLRCLDLKQQIRFIQICKTIKDNIFVTDLCNIDDKLKYKLNGYIIRKYPNIKKLYASSKCCCCCCQIEDHDLVGLNLVELNANNNKKIKKINHMTNLRILYASWKCGIDDDSLISTFGGLNLVKLNAWNNPKIKKINHMTNLRILNASYNCGIGDDDLVGLNLIELDAAGNKKIKKINHMTNLRILNASDNCGIGDDDLVGLNLVELDARYNPKIKKWII